MVYLKKCKFNLNKQKPNNVSSMYQEMKEQNVH